MDWIIEENQPDLTKSILQLIPPRGDTGTFDVFISADSLVFEVANESDTNGKYCSQCLTRRPTSHVDLQLACIDCSSSEIIDLAVEDNPKQIDRARGYLSERLTPWHEMVRDFENENRTLAVYRAEEHTAQISEIQNDEDGYTKTELHELMFMDIPVQTSIEVDLGVKYEQPPIDILSCTTTMEVGIDLGDLNAVALRTVPPHAANYQQRVGRAGRGSSEVSVAMTWVDNSAYAQEFWVNPERLVTNPKDPPTLYLNNRKIRQRHMNAVLFQRFFKRLDYDVDDLTFPGMSPGAGQLLESLGSLEDFVNSTDDYGLNKFVQWVESLRNNPNSLDTKIVLEVSRTNPDEFGKWTGILLRQVNAWKEIQFSEDEEEENETEEDNELEDSDSEIEEVVGDD